MRFIFSRLGLTRNILNLLLAHHFTVTVLYLGPVNPLSIYYHDYVQSYMTPFFAQDWEFFARNLRTNVPGLQYQCEGWRFWKNFGSGPLNSHIDNRFLGRGKRHYYYNYLVREMANIYAKTLSDNKDPKNEMVRSINTKVAFNLIGQSCRKPFFARIVIIEQPDYSSRTSSELSYQILPIYDFGKIEVRLK